ncbi:MAG: MATE family efflux transporter, partial [Actinomycetota bacterium]|nr:MATE family efflux transporter [Actinomycetota bacterium]
IVDTALVGHLGAPELGGVAVGTAAFTASFWIFSFLAYGVTPRVARALGGGDEEGAAAVGVQALFLAVGLGVTVTFLGVLFAEPIVEFFGAEGDVAAFAVPYLRIRSLAAGAVLIGQVGHGWLRGSQNTRTPMFVAVSGASVNAVLAYVLIYPAGFGVEGAAWAVVIAQWGAALAFLLILRRRLAAARVRPDREVALSLLKVGGDLVVRTGALLAALTLATSVATRMGVVALGSWQVGMQIFLLLSFTQDSVAIAGQALVAKYLGQGLPEDAMAVGRRLMFWGVLAGAVLGLAVFLLRHEIANVFTDDQEVNDAAATLIGWIALIQPLSAAAFTLDGILIGASDTRFLAVAMVGCSVLFAAVSLAALDLGWGTAGLASGVALWLAARAGTTGARFLRGRWALPSRA